MEEQILKIKISIGTFTIELEGKSDIVVNQFNDLREKGLGRLSSVQSDNATPSDTQNNKTQTHATKTTHKPSETVSRSGNYPSINDILFKQLPGPEIEWVLVYAFYSTNYGQSSFTRANIIAQYEKTNRKTKQRMDNLTNYISGAVKKGWFSFLNETDALLTDDGKKMAAEILNRTSSSKPIQRNKKKTKTKETE